MSVLGERRQAMCGDNAPLAALADQLGPDGLLTDAASRDFYGGDIMGAGAAPVAIARPASQDAAIGVVRACRQAGIALTARGGGASYTSAHTPARAETVVIDTGRLGRILAIDEDNMTVTVEPGVTWKALDDSLAAQGLRTPFWGSFSGLKATVGGSVSQHAVSLGTGLYDASSSIVTGLKVVTGAGEVIDTGPTPSRFYRTYGPDLTGLFLGDSGAFGVKLELTLRLMRRPSDIAAASFVYERFEDMARAMMAAARLGLASEILAIDPELQKGQLGAAGAGDVWATAKAIFQSSPGPVSAFAGLVRAGLAARDMLTRPSYAVQYIAEGHSAVEARAKIARLRAEVGEGGAETSNALALALRAQPFRPFTPILGPKGERWLPMHGVLPFGEVLPFHAALERLYADRADEMKERRVHMATMFLTVGTNAFIYEPTFYWPDSQHAVHEGLMPEAHRASLPVYPDNPETRAFVMAMKKEIVGLMGRHGAAHYQLGKSYPYFSTREPGSKALLADLKRRFDPDGIMNPGALEFPSA